MNAVQYNSIAFIIELAKIFLAAVCVLPVKMRNIRFFLFAAGLSVTGISIISINIDLYQYGFIYGILSIVIVCIVLEKYPLKIGYIILSYIVICLIDMFFEIVLTYIVEIDTVDILYSIWALLINSISLFILLFIFIYKIKSKKVRQKAYLSGRQIAVFIVLGLSVGVYTAYFELFEIEIRRFQSLAVSGLVISIVITLGICAALISADYENKNLKFQNDMSEKLISQQKDYYLMLLKQGEETKKIRHDFKNHIYAMHILLQNKQLDKLDQYFSDMNTLVEGKDMELHTGNNLVDAIIIHQLSKYDEVVLNWQGKIPIDIAITEMVLCTVFSNLLSNAFEAAAQAEDKRVKVEVRVWASNLYLSIRNNFSTGIKHDKKNLLSTKAGGSHGYGLRNVINCVNDNGGMFEHHIDRDYFTAEVVFMGATNIEN